MPKDDNRVGPFALIPDFEGDPDDLFQLDIPEQVSILPLRHTVAFPLMVMPLNINRKANHALLRRAEKTHETIGLFAVKTDTKQEPDMSDLMGVGVAGRVVKLVELPSGEGTAIVQCVRRVVLTGLKRGGKWLTGSVMPLSEDVTMDAELAVTVATIRKRVGRLLEMQKEIPPEAALSLQGMKHDVMFVNFLCSVLPFTLKEKERMLCAPTVSQRAEELLKGINAMQNVLDLRARIEQRTQADLSQQQREYFLHKEMEVIREELGETDRPREADSLLARARKKDMPEAVRKTFEAEVAKLQRLSPGHGDYSTQVDYLETVVALPWGATTKDNLNLATAERTLNRRHYGMEPVKERILEHLAVMKLRGDMKSPIICLYGPPGVGKTSLGRSVADALKRKYVRASLGGLHDEAEIRGHRRTYIGAMPGRIIKGMAKAGSANPVFILDEIDKLSGMTVSGDPSSALLEVLDPEQNVAFHDNFLEIDYDLSNVMFIATANDIGGIPKPLLDRMELISVSGYSVAEKVEIARRHLWPKALEETGLAKVATVKISKETLEFIIERYTHEKGVRGLEKRLNTICRKVAFQIAKGDSKDPLRITKAMATRFLAREADSGEYSAVKGFTR